MAASAGWRHALCKAHQLCEGRCSAGGVSAAAALHGAVALALALVAVSLLAKRNVFNGAGGEASWLM